MNKILSDKKSKLILKTNNKQENPKTKNEMNLNYFEKVFKPKSNLENMKKKTKRLFVNLNGSNGTLENLLKNIELLESQDAEAKKQSQISLDDQEDDLKSVFVSKRKIHGLTGILRSKCTLKKNI